MVTLEISGTDIRLMEVKGGKVVKWASHTLEPGMFEDGVVADPQALSTAVKQLMTSSGIKERNVIASVSGLYSLSRIVTVATPPGESVTEEAVLEAAGEVIPLSEENMHLSWRTITTDADGQQVLVVGVLRDVIDNEMRALRAVGVKPRILDLKPMALARAANREQALILNIEPTSFDVVMVANGVTEVMRTTAWQMEDLSVEERAEYLVSTLELTVDFYDSSHPGSPLDRATPFFITGQMSGDLALMEELQARVEYPIEPLAPPLEYPAHLPVSQYAVNIGLALKATSIFKTNIGFDLKGRGVSKDVEQGGYSPPDINLLPQVYKPWRPSNRQVYSFLATLAVLALLFPVYQVTSDAMSETARLKTQYTAINNLLELRRIELAQREPLQKTITEYKTIVDMGGGFIEDMEVIRSQAEELGIELQSITHKGSSITFTCQADSYVIFRNYLTALKESGRFSTVTSPAERFPYLTGGALTINLELKPSE